MTRPKRHLSHCLVESMKGCGFAALGLGVATWAQPIWAHHSAAMFDPEREVVANGTVKSWQWSNPHSWLTVLTDDGTKPLELGSPNTLFRSGWRADSFKPGDKITVVFHPLKDGAPGGALIRAETVDGKWLIQMPSKKPASPATDSAEPETKP